MRSLIAAAFLPVALAAGGGAGGCPPSDIGSVASDPVVTDAFAQAWKDSQEGTPGEHEEGGWVYQCAGVDPDDPTAFHTVVERWPKGQAGEITPSPKSSDPKCRLVASFHTHPGPATGHPQNDGYTNEKPSSEDLGTSHDDGVAGFVLFGTGTDPKNMNVVPYGPDEPTTPCPPTDAGTDGPDPSTIEGIGASAGDPHLETFDGFGYDFQASGEFVLVRSTDGTLEIQTRQEPAGANAHATVNTAFAVLIDGRVFEVHDDHIVVDGSARPPRASEEIVTERGGRFHGGPGSWQFEWPDGSIAQIVGRSVAVRLAPSQHGKVEGLLGDADGDPANDLVDRAANSLLADGRLDFVDRYERLAPAWQVDTSNSRFTYEPGSSPSTFALDKVPGFGLYADHFNGTDEAETACRDAGVENPRRLQDCVLDVALTGDPSFAAEAAQLERLLGTWRAEADALPLLTAARNGDLVAVGDLLAAGADVDAAAADGRRALHEATFAGDVAIVDTLIAAGADVDATDDSGSTALHIAATFGLDEIAQALLDAGADATIVDDLGRTAADVADVQGHAALAERLR